MILNKNTVIFGLLFIITFVLYLFLSFPTSPVVRTYAVDSNVFQLMGLLVLKGGIPYVDLFDHKGALLYFIEAFGLWLSKDWGVYFLQVCASTVASFLWFKTFTLFSQNKTYTLFAFLFVWLMLFAYQSGNMTEDWSLPFISYPIYVCIRAIIQNKYNISYKNIFMIGICIACVALIRVNNIIPISGFVVYLLYKNTSFCKYGYILHCILFVLSGIVIVLLPVLIWFWIKGGEGAVCEMYFGTIGFNIEYMSKFGKGSHDVFSFLKSNRLILIMTLFSSFSYIKKGEIVIPLVLSYIISLCFLGNQLYPHYFIIFVPLAVVTIATFIDTKYGKVLYVCVFACCVDIFVKYTDFSLFQQHEEYVEREMLFSQFIEEENVHDLDYSVWVYNSPKALDLMVHNGVLPCNRVLLDFQLGISNQLKYETKALRDVVPKYILKSESVSINDVSDSAFIQQNYKKWRSTVVPNSQENVVLFVRDY